MSDQDPYEQPPLGGGTALPRSTDHPPAPRHIAPAGSSRPGPRPRLTDPDDGFDDEYPDDDYVDDEYVELRPPASRRRRGVTVLLAVLVVMAVAVAASVVWVQHQLDPPGAPGPVRTVVIPRGSTSSDIGTLLAREGVISSASAWTWYLRIKGGGPFEAGTYRLQDHSSIADVIHTLAAGPAPIVERSFTLPEGLTVAETLARLADPKLGLGFDVSTMQELLKGGQIRWTGQPADQPSSEGILFPETYRVSAKADEKAVLLMLVAQLDKVMTELDVASAQPRFNLTPYEVLITASLIEEETKVDAERPMVARVIYNRLKQGIHLGVDATSRYEAVLAGRSRDDVDFTSDSPYNTRRFAGLPPTPIASPGRASIDAALHPADGPWTYYVLKDADGHHVFTDSNQEFLQAKERCRQAGLGCG